MISSNSSRADIIAWLNKLLSTKINKIEELGAGNVYCQLLDAAYPNKVLLQKVKWNAYLEIDFLHNFKILQASFEKLGIKKYIEIQKLIKAKYQDNLQFIQWMIKEISEKIDYQHYRPLERRNGSQILFGFTEKNFQIKIPLKGKENRAKSHMTSSLSQKNFNLCFQNSDDLSKTTRLKNTFMRENNKQKEIVTKKQANKIAQKKGLSILKQLTNATVIESDQQCF